MLKSKFKQPQSLPKFLHGEQKLDDDVNPDHIYYDIVITNLQSTTTVPPTLYYNESRNTPYLPVSGDYNLSIVRFALDTQTLPVFSPLIQPNQPNVDLTTFSITMTYDVGATTVNSAQTFLTWFPQDESAAVPVPPSQTVSGYEDNSTGYYNAYNFQWVIYLVDLAITQAFNSLTANVIAAGGVMPTTHRPIMSWDTQNNIACLTAESSTYNRSLANPILMYFNAPLFTLFSTFVARYLGYQNVLLGKNYLILIDSFLGTNTILLPTNEIPANQYVATQMFQERPSINGWSPISSIVFCSNTLPIVSNNLSAPLVFSENITLTQGNASGNNSNFAQIITDMSVGDNQYSPYVLYNPTAEYRRVSMFGSSPLTNIDISVFWKDKLGVLRPFRLSSGGSCSIKILFEKKDVNNKRSSIFVDN